MDTRAGGWVGPAQLITDSLTRAVIYEKVRHAFRQKRQEDPGDLYSRIVDHQHKLLTGSLLEKFGSTGDVLEKVSYGLVRMILLIHRDPRFVHILDLSWNSAIVIARWADADIDGAAAEIERYVAKDLDTGPRPTRRRYKEVMERLAPEWGEKEPGSGKGPRRPYPINRLTFKRIARDGYADVPLLLATFESFDFSRHVAHVIAAELPSLAREGRDDEINLLVSHLQANGTPSKYLKPVAAFLIRHRMFKGPSTRTALARIDQLPADERFSKSFFDTLQKLAAVPPRPRPAYTGERICFTSYPSVWTKALSYLVAEESSDDSSDDQSSRKDGAVHGLNDAGEVDTTAKPAQKAPAEDTRVEASDPGEATETPLTKKPW